MLSKLIQSWIKNTILQKHPQCSQWLDDWNPGLETQIMVDTTGLEPGFKSITDSKPSHWFDGEAEYRNIRITSGFRDYPIIGPVHRRWECIGTSGWNHAKQQSEWVGFDFDGLNHQSGLTESQLSDILSRVKELDYVVARTSRSAQGIHLLVSLDPVIPTTSRAEHSALAQHVLDRMSRDCGHQFQADIDCLGGILWHYTKGLSPNGLIRI